MPSQPCPQCSSACEWDGIRVRCETDCVRSKQVCIQSRIKFSKYSPWASACVCKYIVFDSMWLGMCVIHTSSVYFVSKRTHRCEIVSCRGELIKRKYWKPQSKTKSDNGAAAARPNKRIPRTSRVRFESIFYASVVLFNAVCDAIWLTSKRASKHPTN